MNTVDPLAQPDLFTRKFRLWAACFDTDRDFVVQPDDFPLAADRWSLAARIPGDDALAVLMRNTLRDVWKTAISIDGRYDKTGATLDEVVAAMRLVLSTPEHPAVASFITFAGLCFRFCDRDDDGQVSEAEFVSQWHAGFAVDPATATAAFRHADTDNARRISADDFLNLSLEFLATEDPTSPAASLLGSVQRA
ncbi:EF-hand domain-containing protein [Streptomyces sp. NPDC127069]|uniref:EF-hand domain-containing protein n=1 Tax=Streptomyces sp. NPDC127069 TaxID=3347128 RepID=UPI00365A6541